MDSAAGEANLTSFASLVSAGSTACYSSNKSAPLAAAVAVSKLRRKPTSSQSTGLGDVPEVHESDHVDDERLRGSAITIDDSRPIPAVDLADAVKFTREAKRKISRVYGKAEELCRTLFQSHVDAQKDRDSRMRVAADEFGLAYIRCGRDVARKADSASIHDRYVSLQEDFRDMLHYDLTGQHERSNLLRATAETLEAEMLRRVMEEAMAWQKRHAAQASGGTPDIPRHIVQVTPRTIVDSVFGLALHDFGPCHEGSKHYVKSLSRFMNLVRCPFTVPLFIAFEVCGIAYVASTLPALGTLVRTPRDDPNIEFGIEAATSELQVEVASGEAVGHTAFGYGLDGRCYCWYAFGLIPIRYPTGFLNLLDPVRGFEPATLDALLTGRMDHAAVEAVAMARSGGGQVTKALHRNGLRVRELGTLHGYLSRQEAIRESTVGAGPDQNLASALTSCVAELLARVLKCVLRQVWAQNIAADASIADEDRGREMAVYAHQLVNLLIVDNHPSRPRTELQLYHTLVELSRQLWPVDAKMMKKKERFVFDEFYVSETVVASRVAHMTGLKFVDGIIAGLRPGRLVRSTRLQPRDMWFEVQRGRHQEVMKRLVSQIKHVRASNPNRAFHLTCHLADIFHQAQGRAGVTRKPADLFDKVAWLRSSQRSSFELNASSKSERSAEGGGSDDLSGSTTQDDPYAVRRELTVLRMLAEQAIATADRDINEAEAAQRDRQAAQQAAMLVVGATANTGRSPKPSSITPLDLPLGGSAAPSPTGLIPMLGMPGAGGPFRSKGPSPLGSARGTQSSRDLKHANIPAVAAPAHSDAVSSFANYMRRSLDLFKTVVEAGPFDGRLSKEDLADKSRVLRDVTELMFRLHAIRRAAAVIRDRCVADFIDATMKTMPRYTKTGVVDPRCGVHIWNALFDAKSACLIRFDGDGAVATARAKLQHAATIFGDESLLVAACHSDLGAVLLNLGRGAEGRRELETGFRHLTQVAPLCTATFTSANNLGYTYFRLAERGLDPAIRKRRHGFLRMALPPATSAQLDEAEAAFRFVVDNREHANVITVADALNNLGSIHTFRGRYSAAVPLFERSLALTRGTYSDEHPDRASAIRNMKTCERRMRSNAALWISCFYKRFKARRQLALLRKGAVHVERFQRIGRGLLARYHMFRLLEYRTIRKIGRGAFDDDAGARYVGDDGDDLAIVDVTSPVAGGHGSPTAFHSPSSAALPVPEATPARGMDAATPPPQTHATASLPGAIDDSEPRPAAPPPPPRVASTRGSPAPLTPMQAEALVVLQSVGRGCLTRGMVRKIHAFRLKKLRRKTK